MFVWSRIVGFLLVGYLCMKRSFAYLGLPPIFIGEVALVAFVLLKPRVAIGTWVSSLLRPSPLNGLGLALLLFVLYGLLEVGRGILSGTPSLYTLKYFVFNYYTIYIFFGMWIAPHSPEYLSKMVSVLAWTNGIDGLLYIALLRHVEIAMPISNMPLFSPAGGGAVAILGLLCFERNLRGVWLVLALNILVTLAWQVRAEWFGLAVGVLAWAFLTGRFGRVGWRSAWLASPCWRQSNWPTSGWLVMPAPGSRCRTRWLEPSPRSIWSSQKNLAQMQKATRARRSGGRSGGTRSGFPSIPRRRSRHSATVMALISSAVRPRRFGWVRRTILEHPIACFITPWVTRDGSASPYLVCCSWLFFSLSCGRFARPGSRSAWFGAGDGLGHGDV